MRQLFIVILCFAQVILYAQDTIYKRSGDVIPAKVIEINTKEISYKRESMPDGPLFILNKNEVKKIKYKTGTVDSFTVYQETPVMPTNLNVMVHGYNEQMKKAGMAGTYYYHGNRISDNRAMLIAAGKNVSWKNEQLGSEILMAKKNKTLQYATGFGGLGVGALALATMVVYSVNEPLNIAVPQVIFVSGLAAVITSQVLSIHFKIRRVRHSDRAVALYNQNL